MSTGGYITLLSVVVLGAISSVVTVSILLLGIQSSHTSQAYQQSTQAQFLADACTEEALQQIRDKTAYTGSDTLSFNSGSCEYTVTNDGGENRTITASGSVKDVTRKVEVTIDAINPDISVTSWQTVADFN